MQLNPLASAILVIVCVVSLLVSGALLFLLYAVISRCATLLESYQAKVDPLLAKTETVLQLANEKLTSIGGKTEAILAQSEEMTAVVHDRVDKTTAIVQRTVNAPLIGINSVWAGLSRGVRTFGALQRDSVSTTDSATDAADISGLRPVPAGPVSQRE